MPSGDWIEGMALTRRNFLLSMGGSAAGVVIFQACGVPERELIVQSPFQLPEDLVTGADNWYATLCRQCSTNEGVLVRVMEGRAKKVEGNPDYPINLGKHGARCEAGLQLLYHPDRTTGPMRRHRPSGDIQNISWADALDELESGLRTAPASRTLLITNPLRGHLAMVVDRFTKEYGVRHAVLEPLELTTLRGAVKEVFDQDRLPDFDIQNTQFLLSFGADFLGTWVSPVRFATKYGEFRQGNRKRGVFVQVEPRLSMTGASADQWVYNKPGSEGLLALSMAYVIISEDLGDSTAANTMTGGEGASAMEQYAPEKVSEAIGASAEVIRKLAHDFAVNRPALAIGGGSAAAHTNGSFNLRAIYSLNYLVGSVNKPGGVIFNTEPPLAELSAASKVTSYREWQSIVDELRKGEIGLVLVRGSDPVHSLAGLGFADALPPDGPKLVSFSSIMDDTAALADVILPEHTYLEDWGDDAPDPGPGYQMVGFQQPVVNPTLDTRSFGDLVLTVADDLNVDMGLPGGVVTFKDLLQEGARQLHASGLGSVKASTFPAFWNGVLQRGGWWDTEARSNGSPPPAPRAPQQAQLASFSGPQESYPYYLVPFSSLSLGAGEGASLPWLQAIPDPLTTVVWHTWVEINKERADELSIREGDEIELISRQGIIKALAYPSPAVSPEVLAVPMGQGHSASGRYAEGRGSNVFSILSPLTDENTGALAWAATRVTLRKTGKEVRLSKFEGTQEAVEAEDANLIQITRG